MFLFSFRSVEMRITAAHRAVFRVSPRVRRNLEISFLEMHPPIPFRRPSPFVMSISPSRIESAWYARTHGRIAECAASACCRLFRKISPPSTAFAPAPPFAFHSIADPRHLSRTIYYLICEISMPILATLLFLGLFLDRSFDLKIIEASDASASALSK